MPSVDKALRVLMVLAEAGPGGMALGQIAAHLGVSKSSLHVTLAALRHRQFVTQLEPSANYYLGPAVSRLSQIYLRSYDIRAILHGALVRLVERIDEVVHIAVLDGAEVVYLDKIPSLKPIQPGTAIGARMPALTTALGRAMLSAQQMDFDAFERRFAERLVRPTPNSPRTIEEAWERIVQARERGFAVDLEENVVGLMAVAVAVLNGDEPVAAVSIVTLASECGPAGPIEHVPELRAILTAELKPPLRMASPSELPA
ncbi:MAG: IclR family transcriptional regulator [Rhizobiales bacterium]|nr:IclR family transcriptional regulator [Hyphomicrobiales bacterium]